MNRSANYDLYLLNHICNSTLTFTDFFNLSLYEGAVRKDIFDQVMEYKTSRNLSFGSTSGQGVVQLLRDVSKQYKYIVVTI